MEVWINKSTMHYKPDDPPGYESSIPDQGSLPRWHNDNISGSDIVFDIFYNVSEKTATNSSTTFGRDEDLAKLEIIVQAIILFFAIFGNSTVLLFLTCRRKKLSRMNVLIVHLSTADLFVAFFNIFPQMMWDITYRFQGGDFLCRMVKYFQVVAMYASSYVLLTTALDRYLAICHPLTSHTWTIKRIHTMVSIAWTFSLLFSLPQLSIFSYQELTPGAGVYDCWGQFDPNWTLTLYITWITCAIYVIPFLILVFAYGRISWVVWRSMMAKEPSMRHQVVTKYERMQNGTSRCVVYTRANTGNKPTGNKPRAHVRSISRSKVKTIKMTLTVVLCYVICWGPFFVAQMWAAWDETAPFGGSVMTIILLLASLNSCTNPWIYMAFSGNICTQISRCFRQRRQHGNGGRSGNFNKMSLVSRTEASRVTNFLGHGVAKETKYVVCKQNNTPNRKAEEEEHSLAIL